MLSRTEDPFGNHYLYDYVHDSDVDALRDADLTPPNAEESEAHHWDQSYVRKIQYADYDDNGSTKYLVSVTFHYEVRPDDPLPTYRCGFELPTRLRFTRIEVRTHADQERLARRYNLVYLDQRNDIANLAQRLPINGISLLSQVHIEGIDESKPASEQTEALQPLEFDYTRFSPKEHDLIPVGGRDKPMRSLAHPDLELADIFGNGRPDIIQMNGVVRYWRNPANGDFVMDDPVTRQGDRYENTIDANVIQRTTRKNGYSIVKLDYYDPK